MAVIYVSTVEFTTPDYRNAPEIAAVVLGLHGGLAQGEGLRAEVHDRVAVVGHTCTYPGGLRLN